MVVDRDKCVALLSGGLDSSVASLLASQTKALELAITFDYGQQAAKKEVEHAKEIAQYLEVPHQVITLPWMNQFQSGLHGRHSLPEPTQDQLDDADFTLQSAQAVWVPNRNGIFIEVAAGIAENLRASHIVVGFNQEEAATFPDNSIAYLNSVNQALRFSTNGRVKVISPTALLEKEEIVAEALRYDFPLTKLWSCYRTENKMCGCCESCMRLKRAIRKNEVNLDGIFENASL